MSKKYFEGQHDDEEVRFVFRHHPVVMRKGLVLGCLGLLAGPVYSASLVYLRPNSPVSMTFFWGSFVASFFLFLIILFPSWIFWYFSIYVVTDQRFIQIKQRGFFNRSVVDVGLEKIQSVNYEVSGLQETLLGFGTIVLQSAVGSLALEEIHHPAEVHEKIIKIIKTDIG
jgi:uncharacterized membrane protein YdbT with pleckstrin-like domain